MAPNWFSPFRMLCIGRFRQCPGVGSFEQAVVADDLFVVPPEYN
jgi:hypothetical protein